MSLEMVATTNFGRTFIDYGHPPLVVFLKLWLLHGLRSKMIQCYFCITQEHGTLLENIVYNTPKNHCNVVYYI
jgi:hypothetical protein